MYKIDIYSHLGSRVEERNAREGENLLKILSEVKEGFMKLMKRKGLHEGKKEEEEERGERLVLAAGRGARTGKNRGKTVRQKEENHGDHVMVTKMLVDNED